MVGYIGVRVPRDIPSVDAYVRLHFNDLIRPRTLHCASEIEIVRKQTKNKQPATKNTLGLLISRSVMESTIRNMILLRRAMVYGRYMLLHTKSTQNVAAIATLPSCFRFCRFCGRGQSHVTRFLFNFVPIIKIWNR